jgi:hypothetical protein
MSETEILHALYGQHRRDRLRPFSDHLFRHPLNRVLP